MNRDDITAELELCAKMMKTCINQDDPAAYASWIRYIRELVREN